MSTKTPVETNTTNLRVAVVQTGSVAFDLEGCMSKLEHLTKTAAGNEAKLVMFPEAFLSAYPRGSFFGAGNEYYGGGAEAGREKYRKYWESSIEIPGPIVDRLSAIAKANHVYLVVGVIERELGTLYCCVLHFDDHGVFLGKHRKLIPTFYERMVWGRGDGSTMPVYNTPVGKLGSVICWENYMPLVRMNMYQKGIQIYCAPNADGTEEWNASMRHIALEGRCFVLSCNQFNRKSDFPAGFLDAGFEKLTDGSDKEGNFIISHGGSCIVSPLGKFMAGPVYDEDAILYADLDLNDCIRGKLDLDVAGHYSRPDVFSLNVNCKEQRNINSFPNHSQSATNDDSQDTVHGLADRLENEVKIHSKCPCPHASHK